MPETTIEEMFAEFEAAARDTFRPPGVPETQRRVRDRRRRRRGLLAGLAALLLTGSAGGYAVAGRGDRSTPSPAPTVSPTGKITERKVALPGVPGRLAEVRFTGAADGWALFDTCERRDLAAQVCRRTVGRTTDGGVSWRRTAPLPAANGAAHLLPVDNATLTVAVGGRYLVTGDGGDSWTSHPVSAPPEAIWRSAAAEGGQHLGCPAAQEGTRPTATCAELKVVLLDGTPLAHQPPVTLQPGGDATFLPGSDGRYWLTATEGDRLRVLTSDYAGGPWRELPAVPAGRRIDVSPDGREVWLVRTDRPNGAWRLVGDRWQPGPPLPDDTHEVAAAGDGVLVVTSTYGGVGFVADGRYLDIPELRANPDDRASVAVLPDDTIEIRSGETQFLGAGRGINRHWIRYS
ncbi:hypothetical protein AB0H57_06500 [Micromonospora sp. NPDC050686]|uniref:hypothetical protein n=1 Tax=Micromonospora sp. NPDC050686 TaxID=3154631 RepID=UPI0033EBF89C